MDKIYRQDLTEPIPELLANADCVYSNPPGSLGRLIINYNNAGITCPYETYDAFLDDFFQYIDRIQPDMLYVRVTASNMMSVLAGCKDRFSHIDVDLVYEHYRKQHRCWIIRCGRDEQAQDCGRDIDVHTYIRRLCRDVEFNCIADIWMTDITAGFNCYKRGKNFACMTMDPTAIDRLKAKIEAFELKQNKKKNKNGKSHN